jgi:hypothetical protein
MAETLAELVISEVKSRRILWIMKRDSYHNRMESINFWDVTTRRHIPEDDTLHNHRCKNLKSYIIIGCFRTGS